MAFSLTQAQLDAAVGDAIQRYSGKRVAYMNAYPGECLSLNKQILTDITGMWMPGAVNGYNWSDGYWLYFDQSAPLPLLFTKTAYVAGRNYPRGSQVFYATTHHIATWLYDNGNGTHTVFEQNADPDGSAAHISTRSNSKITGLLVPVVQPATATAMPGKGAGPTQGAQNMIIPDQDNYYNRFRKSMNLERGRDISGVGFDRSEFRNNFVGRIDMDMVAAVSDDPEADRAHDWMNVGYTAKRDNWEGQISDLTARLAAAGTTIAQLQLEPNQAAAVPETALPSPAPTTTPSVLPTEPVAGQPTAPTTKPAANWLVNLLAFVTKFKAQ